MLDQLECAIRRYQQIAPNAGAEMTQPQADQLADWLERDVGAITAKLLSRPGFRRRARWPIEQLAGTSDSPDRQALLAVDTTLCEFARALLVAAQIPEISAQLRRLGPYQNKVSDGDPSAMDRPLDGLQPTPLGQRTVETIANHSWKELASEWDYFHPMPMLELANGERVQYTPFLKYFNLNLRAPGDYVSRCMEIRISDWHVALRRFYVRCNEARKSAGIDLGPTWEYAVAASVRLEESVERLHHLSRLCDEAKVRDSCIALLQIQVGFQRATDVSWLGPVARLAVGAADIPARVVRMYEWDVPERAAAALIDVSDLFRHQSPEDLIEEMRLTKRLVLIDGERRGYFDGDPIESAGATPEWHGGDNLRWELLFTLADLARARQPVDGDCLSNPKARDVQEPPSNQAVRDRRSDLKKLIRPELNALIVEFGRGTYRLDLEPDEICLLGWLSEDRLVVLPPSPPRIFSRSLIERQ